MPTGSPNAITIWKVREALSTMYEQYVLTYLLPGVNSYLSQLMTPDTLPTDAVPQFPNDSVIIGDLLNVNQPVLCIVGTGEDLPAMGDLAVTRTLRTEIRFKTPRAGDNAPEDFELMRAALADGISDLFLNSSTLAIQPVDPTSGGFLLPKGEQFYNCVYLGYDSIDWPVGVPNNTVRTMGARFKLSASIDIPLNRLYSLGPNWTAPPSA